MVKKEYKHYDLDALFNPEEYEVVNETYKKRSKQAREEEIQYDLDAHLFGIENEDAGDRV